MILVIPQNTAPRIVNFFQKELMCEIFPLSPHPNLPHPVAQHPDMRICRIGDIAVASPDLFKILPTERKICGQTHPQAPYPDEIAYNAAQVGSVLFCHKNTDPILLQEAKKQNLLPIYTKQGYAKCSIVPVGNHALITGDPSIANAAKNHNLDVLTIQNDTILLPGYDHGFFGGCTLFYRDRLYCTGDLSRHPQYEEIRAFCTNRNVELRFPKRVPLTDLGSPILLK